jgi:hypothetical protein
MKLNGGSREGSKLQNSAFHRLEQIYTDRDDLIGTIARQMATLRKYWLLILLASPSIAYILARIEPTWKETLYHLTIFVLTGIVANNHPALSKGGLRRLFPLQPRPGGRRSTAARTGVSDYAGFAPN